MRALKSRGGLTTGRGVALFVRLLWVRSIAFMQIFTMVSAI